MAERISTASLNVFRRLQISILNKASKSIVLGGISILAVDLLYKFILGISLQTRQNCVLYANTPRWLFIFYEYVIELMLMVLAGIFAAEFILKYFRRLRRFVPGNIFSAFVYASVIPFCSCSAIPLMQYLRQKVKLRVLVTFVMAAPLLNPYTVFVSFTVLGLRYSLLRILSSFILAAGLGIIAELAARSNTVFNTAEYQHCGTERCGIAKSDIYSRSITATVRLIPVILLSGTISIFYETGINNSLLRSIDLTSPVTGLFSALLVGLPILLCNGADILFLKPLIHYNHLPIGTALAFSLTSTAVCINSAVMLSRFLGRQLTVILVISLTLIVFMLGLLVNLLEGAAIF